MRRLQRAGQIGHPSLMRALLFLIFTLLASPGAFPALAAEWEGYGNARFGYEIEVPPGFEWGPEADNGDGRSFRDGATRLAVWGGMIVEADLESEAREAIGFATSDGWAVTYEATTPSWASFSGMQGKRVLYERMIALCDGSYAAFRLEYSTVDMAKMDPVVERLVRTLKGADASC